MGNRPAASCLAAKPRPRCPSSRKAQQNASPENRPRIRAAPGISGKDSTGENEKHEDPMAFFRPKKHLCGRKRG
ncbi:hypothetical protein ASZ90_001944 [hydrocarbon metagenome]|uniref:Uncharacterized protein n=1 Tax=hydrocarbon metagenome TaxID=938273 RepID=A0A0W8G4Z6_9ZZZZ